MYQIRRQEKGAGVRQNVHSIFWEAHEAISGILVGQEWGRREGCITESRLEDRQSDLWVLGESWEDGSGKTVIVCCLAASLYRDF